MKKLISFILIALLATLTLTACEGEDNRVDTYLDRLDAIDQTDLRELNYWFSENAESIDELFNIRPYYVDVDGSALDYETQVSGLDQDRFVGWAVDVNEEQYRLTFTYIWDISNPPEVVLQRLEEARFISQEVEVWSDEERFTSSWILLGDADWETARGIIFDGTVRIQNGTITLEMITYFDSDTRFAPVYEHGGLSSISLAAQTGWEILLEGIGVTEEEMIAFFEWYIELWYNENNE